LDNCNDIDLSIYQLADTIADGVCVCHQVDKYPYIKFVIWNKKMVEITGYTMEEINVIGWLQVVYPSEGNGKNTKKHIFRAESENDQIQEYEIIGKGGIRKIIEARCSLIKTKISYVIAHIKDVTFNNEMEIEFEELQERYEKLFKLSPDAIFVHGNGKIVFCNQSAAELLEVEKPEDLHGEPILKYVYPKFHQLVMNRVKKVQEEGNTLPQMYEQFITKKGNIIDVEVSVSMFPYKCKQFSLVFIRNITERKKMQNALIESEALLRQVTENTTDMISIVDTYGKFQYVTPSHKTILGYEVSQLLNKPIMTLIHEEDKAKVKEMYCNILNGNDKCSVECRYRHSKGHYIYLEVIVKILNDNEGKIEKFILSSRDITKRVETEKALRKSEGKYRELFNNVNDSIYLHKLNSDGTFSKFKEVNDVACRTLEYTREELMNLTVLDVNEPIKKEDMVKMKEEMLVKGSAIHHSVRKTKSGRRIPNEINSILIELEGEKYILSIARDISERIKAMENLQEKTRLLYEAVEYDRVRTEFFANISHELRTPINVILSTLQLLSLKISKGIIYDEMTGTKKYISTMKQNCYRLIRLINNIIDVTKIDAGYFYLNESNNNIVSVVEEITLSIAEYVENKGISIIFDTDIEEKVIACDPDIIERIVLNLISNSIKFTEAGGCILIRMKDMGDRIIISVKDTGIGIPAEKQKAVFERFIQVDKSLTRNREGSGIGLSLVKSLVEMHRGTIYLNSKYGEGSEFIIELPSKALSFEGQEVTGNNYKIQGNIEKIKIEFSDIYF
jgi:PAS domain S-box-containing protein